MKRPSKYNNFKENFIHKVYIEDDGNHAFQH